ncbi:hypothetical protein D9M71_805610 [compost metagenome]
MNAVDAINSLKMVTLALEEVQRFDGRLPTYSDPAEGEQPTTFLQLAKQYAGNRVPESALVEVIDALSPLLAPAKFTWK